MKTVRSGPHHHDSGSDHDRMQTRNPVREDHDLEVSEDLEDLVVPPDLLPLLLNLEKKKEHCNVLFSE